MNYFKAGTHMIRTDSICEPHALVKKPHCRQPTGLLPMRNVKIRGSHVKHTSIDFVPASPGLRTAKS